MNLLTTNTPEFPGYGLPDTVPVLLLEYYLSQSRPEQCMTRLKVYVSETFVEITCVVLVYQPQL